MCWTVNCKLLNWIIVLNLGKWLICTTYFTVLLFFLPSSVLTIGVYALAVIGECVHSLIFLTVSSFILGQSRVLSDRPRPKNSAQLCNSNCKEHIFGANLNRNFHFLGLSWPFPIDLPFGVMGPFTRRTRDPDQWKLQENPTLLCFPQVPSRLRSSVPLDFGISLINGFGVLLLWHGVGSTTYTHKNITKIELS